MKIRNLLLCAFFLLSLSISAQIAPNKYYIQFTDKNNSPYSIDNPSEFLTQRAIDRREKYDIAIDYKDIPVNTEYLQGVANIGVELLNATRWLNGVTITTHDDELITQIEALPYVASIRSFVSRKVSNKKLFFEVEDQQENNRFQSLNGASELDYGDAFGQIDQLNGINLHDEGFQGQGMVIGVLDSGFEFADIHPAFDSLFANGQILGTKDFVNPGGNVYTEHFHGLGVLSCMGANVPGQMVGTAPKASFWLLRTEDAPTENYIEEFNWLSGAEFADSVGVDVINSSLGYFEFDMPEWNHNYEDLDGNTAIATQAVDIAAAKGILVCVSAGNNGDSGFPYNGTPADADSVLSVGAVWLDDSRISFSAIGPTTDGRIKPAIMACGAGATVAQGENGFNIGGGFGTSYSSPIFTGMVTCLLQASPEMTVMEIQAAVKESASMADNPDNEYGWGIPDFEAALGLLTSVNTFEKPGDVLIKKVSPNPFSDHLSVELNLETAEEIEMVLFSINGATISRESKLMSPGNNKIEIGNIAANLPAGMYYLRLSTSNKMEVTKLVKK